MTIINLTPQDVAIVDKNDNVKAVFPSKGIAHAAQIAKRVGELDGIELVSIEYGTVEGLPMPQDGIFYIVTHTTAKGAKAAGRSVYDLLIVADPVHGQAKTTINCRWFMRLF